MSKKTRFIIPGSCSMVQIWCSHAQCKSFQWWSGVSMGALTALQPHTQQDIIHILFPRNLWYILTDMQELNIMMHRKARQDENNTLCEPGAWATDYANVLFCVYVGFIQLPKSCHTKLPVCESVCPVCTGLPSNTDFSPRVHCSRNRL